MGHGETCQQQQDHWLALVDTIRCKSDTRSLRIIIRCTFSLITCLRRHPVHFRPYPPVPQVSRRRVRQEQRL